MCSFQVAAAGHFVGCEGFDQEGCRGVDGVGVGVGVECGDDLAEGLVVGADEVEQADAVGQRGPAQFVGAVQSLFVGVVQERQERRCVVLGQSVQWVCSCPDRSVGCARAEGSACTGCRVEQVKSFVQVERGEHGAEVGAQFDHGEGDVGVDPDDHRAGAAEVRHLGDVPQGVGGEGVERRRARRRR